MARALSASRPGDPQPARPPRRAADRADLRRHHRRQLRLRRAAGAAGAEHRHGERGFRRGEPGRDVFQLGNTSYRILKIEAGGCAWRTPRACRQASRSGSAKRQGAATSCPSRSPACAGNRPAPASAESQAAERLQPVIDWLAGTPGIPREAAQQIVEYLSRARAALGALPTQRRLIMERFFDESGGTQLVIHSPMAAASTVPGAWRCASASAAPSTSSCRRQPPRTRSSSRCRPVTASRWMRSGATCIRPVPNRCDPGAARRAAVRRALALDRHYRAGPAAHGRRAQGGAAAAADEKRTCWPRCSPIRWPAWRTSWVSGRFPTTRWCARPSTTACTRPWTARVGWRCCGAWSGEVELLTRDLPAPSPLAMEILGARPYAFLDDARWKSDAPRRCSPVAGAIRNQPTTLARWTPRR